MTGIIRNNTDEKWEEIKTHPFYAEMREQLLAVGEKYLQTPPPPITYSAYRLYYETGNRSVCEASYFDRRGRIAVLTALTKMYGDKYLPALCDALWAVLEESSWVLPAHLPDGCDNQTRREYLDLFSTETGRRLAETDHILGDVLPKVIRERIAAEVRERTILSYFKNFYWWMRGHHNWGAVCSANVGIAIMLLGTEDEFRRAEPMLDRTVNLFLASYGKDGCCLEGLSYWNYGFGFFLEYADAVRNYSTDHPFLFAAEEERETFTQRNDAHDTKTGVIDYFRREDVHRAALFAAKLRLHGDYAISFSDADLSFFYNRGYFSLLYHEYPGEISCPPLSLSPVFGTETSGRIIRPLLWSDPELPYGAPLLTGTQYFDEGQWFIRSTDRFSFAAKGGSNDEPHNHNDIGTFLLTTDRHMPLCDTGSGEYTQKYFDGARRYEYLVCHSFGHSVPVVNGKGQSEGAFRATVTEKTDDTFALSFAGAYEEETLSELTRRFACDGEGVTVTDTYVFSSAPASVRERLVSFDPPVFGEGGFTVPGARVGFDPAVYTVETRHETYSDHKCRETDLYLTDLIPKKTAEHMTLSFRVDVTE